MDYIEPWKTVIGSVSLEIDVDRLLAEVLSNPLATERDSSVNDMCHPEHTPYFHELREQVITPLVRQYLKDNWDIDAQHINTCSWMSYGSENPGIEPHYHSHSHFTTILYLTDTPGDLHLHDPRGPACRGYPTLLREKMFATQRIKPRVGDLHIFPCFVMHHVPAYPGEFRMGIVTDYAITE